MSQTASRVAQVPAATSLASVALLAVASTARSSADRTETLPSVCISAAKGPAVRRKRHSTCRVRLTWAVHPAVPSTLLRLPAEPQTAPSRTVGDTMRSCWSVLVLVVLSLPRSCTCFVGVGDAAATVQQRLQLGQAALAGCFLCFQGPQVCSHQVKGLRTEVRFRPGCGKKLYSYLWKGHMPMPAEHGRRFSIFYPCA